MKKKLFSLLLAICLIINCGVMLTACGKEHDSSDNNSPAPHIHSWLEEWSSNYNEHWHACSGCNEKKDITTHTIDGYICTICGYNTWHTCEYGSKYYKGEEGHWQFCQICNKKHITSHSGEPCSVCGYYTHAHTYNWNDFGCDDEYHWQICHLCDDPQNKQVHNLDSRLCRCGYKGSEDMLAFRNGNLEVSVYQNDDGGTYTVVKLPDGKNMLIDSTDPQRINHSDVENKFRDYFEGLLDIDYMVITNPFEYRSGGALTTLKELNVKKLFIPKAHETEWWHSEIKTKQIEPFCLDSDLSQMAAASVNTSYDNCNPVALAAGEFGDISAITKHTNLEAPAETLADFEALSSSFATFMANFDTIKQHIVTEGEAYEDYEQFFAKAVEIYNENSLISFTKNVSIDISKSAIIGLNNNTASKYFTSDSVDGSLRINNKLIAAKLFGYEHEGYFEDDVETLVSMFAEQRNKIANGQEVNVALDNSSFYTNNGSFIIPIAIKNEQPSTLLLYIIIDSDGSAYLWVSDLAAIREAVVAEESDMSTSSWPCIVNNEFYCKDTLFVSGDEGVSYELPKSYTNAVSYAKSLPNCEVITLSKSNEDDHDITNTFSYNSQEYSYTIDFITPLEHIECKDEFEQSIFIAINYQNKTILLTGDATNANIDNYAKADHGYDVDVLITGYVSGEHKDAIRLSANRGTDFLGDINLTKGDNAIITYYDIDQMQSLMNVIGYRHATLKPLTVYESVRTKINADGTITITTVER